MKSYIALMLFTFCIGEVYSQNNDLYLKVQSLKEIEGNYIIKATDVEKQYTDTLTLISFKNSIYVDGQLKNQLDYDYGNLLQLKVGSNYIFRLFKLITQISTRPNIDGKLENINSFIYSLGKDASWISYFLNEAPYGVMNALADTIQYFNPILPIVDSVPNPTIRLSKETITKLKVNSPGSLREKADMCIRNGTKNKNCH